MTLESTPQTQNSVQHESHQTRTCRDPLSLVRWYFEPNEPFHQFHSKGEKQNKEEFIKSLSVQDGTITEVINGDMNVTFHGNNIATVLGSHVTKGTDKAGKAFSRTTVWNDTYMEREGKWQCIASGSTTVVPEKK